jgi:hypothetical protein
MKNYVGTEIYLHAFLTLALEEGKWSRFIPAIRVPRNHWIEGWVDPRAGLEGVLEGNNLCPAGNRTPVV